MTFPVAAKRQRSNFWAETDVELKKVPQLTTGGPLDFTSVTLPWSVLGGLPPTTEHSDAGGAAELPADVRGGTSHFKCYSRDDVRNYI